MRQNQGVMKYISKSIIGLIIYGILAFHALAMPKFFGKVESVPTHIQSKMRLHSWRPDCPVPIERLAYLTISYLGYDEKIHQGKILVHKDLAEEVLDIFKEIFEARFSIFTIQLIDEFEGNDDASMKANNTSVFNCREITGKLGILSKHSYGSAIDINPIQNPYVLDDKVLPPSGKKFLDRSVQLKGMIRSKDAVYKAFTKRGWQWGGEWKSLKDYQHFEKANHPEIKSITNQSSRR